MFGLFFIHGAIFMLKLNMTFFYNTILGFAVLWVFCFSFSAMSTAVEAQTLQERPLEYQFTHINNPYYDAMVSEAVNQRPDNYDFTKLRSLYTQTSQYDPIGNDVLEKFNKLAYVASTDEDKEKVANAMLEYRTLARSHLAHMGVILSALSLARDDPRFGPVDFLEWVQDGLIESIVRSGDGYSLNTSYDIITLPEEEMLFIKLGLKQIDTQSVNEGYIFYNMHDVVDLKRQKRRTLFVNTTIPLRYLTAVKKEQDATMKFDIRRR